MNADLELSGATRLVGIVGDPIAQVKSPAGVTRRLRARGIDAVCVPFHVASADFAAVMGALAATRNIDGMIVTVPHKFAALPLCASASERARFTGAANVLRRNPDRSWHGDMLDGLGFAAAQRDAGARLDGARALLAGAGGAGSAIALGLLEAGVAHLAVHDADPARRDALIARLAERFPGRVGAGSADPAGVDVVANATPMGMRAGDPYPVAVERLAARMHVGDVVTVPEVPPLLVAARQAGCSIQTGTGMFARVLDLMIDFFDPAPAAARG
ncbi:MAG: shikimate dehydrogenase [Burkholderiales bacterium]|nr:shikimate dehydrogenase [Burkholderiales bacterium]